jgi:S-(hydroxymethyl)glutathione dehydrogenase/alcohol dehydrogenase
MITFEEWVVPVFTKATAADLGMVCSCVAVAGLGATASQAVALVEPGSIVAVVGCGPLGLSGVQGAKISGASTIIAIDPVRARREVAMKVGATHALDPNAEGDKLVERVRELSKGPNNRLWAGGRDSGGLLGGAGADFVLEAVGADQAPPKVEAGPDPTGILPLRQAYEMCAPGGHIVTTSLPRGNITLPAGTLHPLAAVRITPGRLAAPARCATSRDLSSCSTKGQYNAKALATSVVSIERMLEAYEDVVYRTTVTAIITA